MGEADSGIDVVLCRIYGSNHDRYLLSSVTRRAPSKIERQMPGDYIKLEDENNGNRPKTCFEFFFGRR
jgi:hypothetical protein